ncbi:hypothetical protein DL765_001462 [Monosporascus sp. GIB2]|nr:hypothetical protein DL765_001462 [Monosporascus sp. GIB2]
MSSVAGIVGRASLSAYNAGNVYQDALAHYRNMLGERATSLDLGGVADEGYLAQHRHRMADFQRISQVEMLYMKEIYAMLDIHCNGRYTSVDGSRTCQHIVGIRPPAHWSHIEEVPFTLAQPFWGHMHHLPGIEGSAEANNEFAVQAKPHDVAKEVAAAQSTAEAAVITSEALLLRVSTTLGIPKERLDPETPLISYGIDSLSAMDLRNWIGRVFNIDIPIFDIQGGASLVEVARTIALKLRQH